MYVRTVILIASRAIKQKHTKGEYKGIITNSDLKRNEILTNFPLKAVSIS